MPGGDGNSGPTYQPRTGGPKSIKLRSDRTRRSNGQQMEGPRGGPSGQTSLPKGEGGSAQRGRGKTGGWASHAASGERIYHHGNHDSHQRGNHSRRGRGDCHGDLQPPSYHHGSQGSHQRGNHSRRGRGDCHGDLQPPSYHHGNHDSHPKGNHSRRGRGDCHGDSQPPSYHHGSYDSHQRGNQSRRGRGGWHGNSLEASRGNHRDSNYYYLYGGDSQGRK